MHATPVQRTILSTRRIMVPPLTLCAYMKKGPNLRWSLIQCSGGDEGDRTPDLLTASQALSQLSYAPVRRSTIRELSRRCKGNFGKTFAGGARGGAAAARLSSAHMTSRVPPYAVFAFAARSAIRSTAIPPASGPLSGAIKLPPAQRLQNHAGLRGQAGDPRACRNRQNQNRR